MKTYLKLGDWNAVCDVCGFKFKASQMKKRWDGLMVCSEDYELRNPLDFIKVPNEKIDVPWARPDLDTSDYVVCTYEGSQAVAGLGVAGCARTGTRNP
jgi:hypothetical protein